MTDSAPQLWSEFLASGSPEASAAAGAAFTAWAFGDSPGMADRLLALVLGGGKRATCGSLWAYEARGEPLPVEGEFSVVLDGSGIARCVLRTTSIAITAFDDVGADFARAEGEGDLSLESWRTGHWAYFERELGALGMKPSGDMPLACERFEVLYPTTQIVELDHASPDVADAIRAVMLEAYRVEAAILGVADFVPLRRTTAEIADAPTSFRGIWLDGGLVAVAELEDIEPGLRQISALVVSPAYFRQGLATALLRDIIETDPSAGLTVSTGVGNTPALELYAAHGFRKESRWTTPDGIPMITLVRRVDADR